MLSRLQALDLHPKVAKDFAVRTRSGALASLGAIVIATALFISEFLYYQTSEKVEHMEVDPIRGAKMRINFDITFPDVPCAGISLDAMDASGQHQEDILHDVFKRRIDAGGNAVGHGERGELKKTVTTREALLKEKQRAIADGRTGSVSQAVLTGCGDCYGAGEPGQCCNSCEDVRAVYRKKGWQFNMKTVDQCNKEGLAGDLQEQLKAGEGCNLYGHLEVPKVAGHFHFAPAHSMQHAFTHVNDLVNFAVQSFNITHKINTLTFGEYIPVSVCGVDGWRGAAGGPGVADQGWRARVGVLLLQLAATGVCVRADDRTAASPHRSLLRIPSSCLLAPRVAGRARPPRQHGPPSDHWQRHAPILRQARAHPLQGRHVVVVHWRQQQWGGPQLPVLGDGAPAPHRPADGNG